MAKYGIRYLPISIFQSSCAELKIGSKPADSELELYEREGVLLPAARIIKPDKYILKRRQTDQHTDTYGQQLPEWEDLERLLYGKRSKSDSHHSFDWEFEKKNKFLLRPKVGEFEPWGSFKVEVKSATGEKYNVSSVEHYYHYWQAYLVDEIQSKYPVFAKNNWLLENLNDEAKEMVSYYKPSFSHQIYGSGGYFDALSVFIELYTNEERRTFAPIIETDGYEQLNNEQLAHYHEQLRNHAKFVLQRFDLNSQELYQFLIDILRRQADYQRNERLKLAEALGNDAIFLTRLIYWAIDKPASEIEEEIGKQVGFGVQQQFRHLDKALEIYDYACDTFERLMSQYNDSFPDFNISTTDIDGLLKFIEDKRLFVIPYAIFDIDETLNNPRRFRLTSLYVGLSNLATGFECYLREIANIVNHLPSSTDNIPTDTLSPMIQKLFGEWGGPFNREHSKRKNDKLSDIEYIEDVYTSPSLSNVLKAFLIACKARNFTAHNYTIEPYFYRYLLGIVYTEICNSLFYSWKYASRKGWI
jgi:hypothetical protein